MLKAITASLIASLSLLHADHHEKKKTEPKWTPLFNGENLNGWTPKFSGSDLGVNYKDTFKVENKLLTIDYSKWDKFNGEFGHLFYKTPYSHYKIRATYRFLGEQVKGGPGWANRNNGFMLHCQDPKTMKKDQDFPDSIEVQFLGGLGKGKRGTLNICTPGTQLHWNGKLTKAHVINTNGPTIHGDDWVTVEVVVRGDQFTHTLNGKTAAFYTKTQLDDGSPLTSGYLAIQAETAPIQFKSIELMELKK